MSFAEISMVPSGSNLSKTVDQPAREEVASAVAEQEAGDALAYRFFVKDLVSASPEDGLAKLRSLTKSK
jgi:hypothetical protein